MNARRSYVESIDIVLVGLATTVTCGQTRGVGKDSRREWGFCQSPQPESQISISGMTLVRFSELPDSARIWAFGSEAPITGAVADTLLAEVDQYLDQWKAHGFPLKAAREWKENRFLVIGIDPTAE